MQMLHSMMNELQQLIGTQKMLELQTKQIMNSLKKARERIKEAARRLEMYKAENDKLAELERQTQDRINALVSCNQRLQKSVAAIHIQS